MKNFIILCSLAFAQTSFAQVYCLAQTDHGEVKVQVLDTFVNKSVIIDRSGKRETLAVETVQNKRVTQFFNRDAGFSLMLDNLHTQRSLPVTYRGYLEYADMSVDADCTVE